MLSHSKSSLDGNQFWSPKVHVLLICVGMLQEVPCYFRWSVEGVDSKIQIKTVKNSEVRYRWSPLEKRKPGLRNK